VTEQEVLDIIAAREAKQQERREGRFEGMTLPLTDEQFCALDHDLKKELKQMTQHWQTKFRANEGQRAATVPELLAAALGTAPCPSCKDTKWLSGKDIGTDTGYWELNHQIRCSCRHYRMVQSEFDQLVGWRYRSMDFRTAKPSAQCFLPLERQQKNWDEARAHINSNFFLAGSAASGKTTLAAMIAREAIWRNLLKREDDYSPNPTRWVWVVDADELFRQYTEWVTSRYNDNPAPEPTVTPRKIAHARKFGYTPTLVLEELDKGKMTESRFDFLFAVVNAMDKEQGQLIVTTNRTLPRFMALFTESESETIRTSGEPMMRRFLDNCVRQFSFRE